MNTDNSEDQPLFLLKELEHKSGISYPKVIKVMTGIPPDGIKKDSRKIERPGWFYNTWEQALLFYNQKMEEQAKQRGQKTEFAEDLKKRNIQLKNEYQELKNAQLRGELFSRELIYEYMVEWKSAVFSILKQLILVRLPVEWAGKSPDEIRPLAEDTINEVSGEFEKSTESIINKFHKSKATNDNIEPEEPA